ncbi:putative membrane protein YfcA [Actinoplanes octamycinicus]|uniref:Probable membrane transporter protein n=2 Tax=Actinoplanes octamycinicus TaxID=135948 RepID=A0A7W7H3P3_9ACTN|nr:putative membrane protein YfcA [Actinoplanes octamycinicus]
MGMLALLAAGLLGGMVNALAGGATLLTFPALMATGLTPVVANASNAVALAPSHLLAAVADHVHRPPVDRLLRTQIGLSILGGICGSGLLLVLPTGRFPAVVPVLIGVATALFAVAPRLRGVRVATAPGLLLASAYGGFFGAALGVILSALLALGPDRDARRVNARKNILASAATLAAVAVFVAKGLVAWPATVTVLAGAVAGGWLGGRISGRIPATAVRAVVIAGGVLLTLFYAHRFW